MHRTLAITSATALMLVAGPSTAHGAARASPRLELPASWFAIVEPYRYDEPRRFERGWNRGADVVVADGDVRSPVAGRVRFAGDVAGRSVVTVEARVDGLPVVVTMTGLDRRAVREGERVGRGTVLGVGRDVHVGMYDRGRRSRYLPVVPSTDPAPPHAPPTVERSPLADAIANRLLDAIRGDVATLAPGTVPPSAMGSSGIHDLSTRPLPRPTPARGDAAALAGVAILDGVGAVRATSPAVVPAAPSSTRTRAPSDSANHREGARGSTPRLLRAAPDARDMARVLVGHAIAEVVASALDTAGADRRDVRSATRRRALAPLTTTPGAATRRTSRGADNLRGGVGSAGRATPPIGGAAVGPPRGDRYADVRIATEDPEVVDDATVRVERVGSEQGRRARWSIPAAIAAALAVLVLAVRRRRWPVVTPVVPVELPLPPLLPSMHRRPLRPVRTDGRSIIGGTPIAWSDTESGSTTHEPELLRHDAHLLPERAAAPGARVHVDRRGRDHPLPATHGPGRVLPDGD